MALYIEPRPERPLDPVSVGLPTRRGKTLADEICPVPQQDGSVGGLILRGLAREDRISIPYGQTWSGTGF